MEANHWFSENFKKPESMYDFGHFTIWITGDDVKIECTNASGTEFAFTDFESISRFFEKHKQELIRRSNSLANNEFDLTS